MDSAAPERLFCGVGAGVYLRGGMTARVSLVPFSNEVQERSGGKREQRRGPWQLPVRRVLTLRLPRYLLD
jgi:hypothetical protein